MAHQIVIPDRVTEVAEDPALGDGFRRSGGGRFGMIPEDQQGSAWSARGRWPCPDCHPCAPSVRFATVAAVCAPTDCFRRRRPLAGDRAVDGTGLIDRWPRLKETTVERRPGQFSVSRRRAAFSRPRTRRRSALRQRRGCR